MGQHFLLSISQVTRMRSYFRQHIFVSSTYIISYLSRLELSLLKCNKNRLSFRDLYIFMSDAFETCSVVLRETSIRSWTKKLFGTELSWQRTSLSVAYCNVNAVIASGT